MANLVTLGDIRNRVRLRGNLQGQGSQATFITDVELNLMINESWSWLYDIINAAYQGRYFSKFYTFGVVSGQDTYPVPSDFFKLRYVDLSLDATHYATVNEFNEAERNRYNYAPVAWAIYGFTNILYILEADNIRFIPMPASAPAGNQVRLAYVPNPTVLVLDTDSFDGRAGWENLVTLDVLIKVLIKQDLDYQGLMALRDAQVRQIKSSAATRDVGKASRVQDVTSSRSGSNYGWGGGG